MSVNIEKPDFDGPREQAAEGCASRFRTEDQRDYYDGESAPG